MLSSATGTPQTSSRGQTHPLNIMEAYFRWLYEQVFDPGPASESFTVVCWIMHQVPFQVLVRGDDNRVAEAAGLRNGFKKFAGSLGPEELSDLMSPDASVFEVLVALTDRATFIVPLGHKVWFRIFIENLDLDDYNDQHQERRSDFPIEQVIAKFNDRRYTHKGRGGIFPLRQTRNDQRQVELWYQMGEYMTSNSMY
jgi:hypothetical protein